MKQYFEPEKLHYYKSIDAFVLVPHIQYDGIVIKEILEDARARASQLTNTVFDSVNVDLAEPMTLGQYLPVLRESLAPTPVESDDVFDHMFATSRDSFYSFAQAHSCVLDTQIVIKEARKRQWKNRFKKDKFFNADVTDHDITMVDNVSIPAPVKRKIMGNWDYYNTTVIQHSIADDTLLTIDDPTDFHGNHNRAVVATATSLCTIPKYAYLNAMSAVDQRINYMYNCNHDCSGYATPIVIYTEDEKPWKSDPSDSETTKLHDSLSKIAIKAAQTTSEWLEDIMNKKKKPKS